MFSPSDGRRAKRIISGWDNLLNLIEAICELLGVSIDKESNSLTYEGTVSTMERNPETGEYETVTRTYSHYIFINGEKYPVDIDNSGSETKYYYYNESNGVGGWSPIVGDNIKKIRPKVR